MSFAPVKITLGGSYTLKVESNGVVQHTVRTEKFVSKPVKSNTVVDQTVKRGRVDVKLVKNSRVSDKPIKSSRVVDQTVKSSRVNDKPVLNTRVVYETAKSNNTVDRRIKSNNNSVNGSTDKKSIIKAISLDSHNSYRSRHKDTPSLTWDESLAAESQKWADNIAKMGVLKHGTTGENIYMFGTSADVDTKSACEKAVESWYAEIKNYNLKTHSQSGTVGHFTQVVWSSSKKLGVGVSKTKSNGMTKVYVVARYTPGGNMRGDYEKNVKPCK